MLVNPKLHSAVLRSAVFVCAVFPWAGAVLFAQGQNPSSAANPYFGSVTAHPATDDVLKLSLDDAVHRGLENNLGLKQAEYSEKAIDGEKKVGPAGIPAHHYTHRRYRLLSAQPGRAGLWLGIHQQDR